MTSFKRVLESLSKIKRYRNISYQSIHIAVLMLFMAINPGNAEETTRPTLWLIGDSTMQVGTKGQRGWGSSFSQFFNDTISIANRARGGRSTRTFMQEGLWDKVCESLKPGDYVIMQFGHNDGGPIAGEFAPGRAARGSIPGNGDESKEAIMPNGSTNIVHSYGWYLRKFANDAKDKGAKPIIFSPIPRSLFRDGKVIRSASLRDWAKEAAEQVNVPFLDVNSLIADCYDEMGEDAIKPLFADRSHTKPEGAALNAKCIARGIRDLPGSDLKHHVNVWALVPETGNPPRQMERLDRGVVALPQEDGTSTVSWRVLGTDPTNIVFNLYRSVDGGEQIKLNAEPLDGPTFFIDDTFPSGKACKYNVVPILDGVEQSSDGSFNVAADAPCGYLSIPVKKHDGYTVNDGSVGDLDGDGQYELIVMLTNKGKDNSHSGVTESPILQAYKLDGTFLWEINLGRNIREGAHYTQFLVYDFDGDGRAELVCKTADGTVDGIGKVIGDPNADWRNKNGYILSGPEFLTVFDGRTGAALDTVEYIPPRHPDTMNPTSEQLKEVWGDGYGNRVDRFLACVAYLDGQRPSIVMCRGYYTRSVLAAWDWRDGKLTRRWVFDSDDGTPGNRAYRGQGNHSVSVADVDGDGCDEIIYGSMVVNNDGTGLHSTGLDHGDALHVSDFDPSRPGFEVFMPHESINSNGGIGTSFRDARTGEILWTTPGDEDVGRGMTADIDPRYPGAESWASNSKTLYSAKGEPIGKCPDSFNFGIWWEGTLTRQLLDNAGPKGDWHGVVYRWDWENEKQVTVWEDREIRSNNWTKGNPVLSGDILGDWREEMIWRTKSGDEIRIYVTPHPTEHRFVTLMHDPQYRLAIAWQNVSYNQPPHPGFFLGEGMEQPPPPAIYVPIQE